MIRTLLLALLCCALLLPAQQLVAQGAESAPQEEVGPAQVEGKLIELSVLEGMANSANAGKKVTVLFTLERAEVVNAATSVERTFEKAQAPKMQPVSRSNSIFITGSAAVVQEAVVRLRALDEATPEPTRRNYRSQSPEETAAAAAEALDPAEAPDLRFSMFTLMGGIALLAFFVALIVRRSFR
jgi:hypothetical protein